MVVVSLKNVHSVDVAIWVLDKSNQIKTKWTRMFTAVRYISQNDYHRRDLFYVTIRYKVHFYFTLRRLARNIKLKWNRTKNEIWNWFWTTVWFNCIYSTNLIPAKWNLIKKKTLLWLWKCALMNADNESSTAVQIVWRYSQ